MKSRIALALLTVLVSSIPSALASCRCEQQFLPYEVRVDWWDGTSTSTWQWGWFDVYVCDGGSGGGGGGGADTPPEPPYLSISEVSDANPGQPLLHIFENDSIVETTLAYNGSVISTTGKTDVLFLQPLSALSGTTTVSVQARNSANVYATAVFHITREFAGPFASSTVVLATWSQMVGGNPELMHGQWSRTVHLGTTHTSYDIITFDVRTGEWEHNFVEDQIAGVSALTPNPAWDTRYYIDNPQLMNTYYGLQCNIDPIAPAPYSYGTICTDVDAFTRAGSPAGRAVIRSLDVPYGVTTLIAGDTVSVSP